MIRKKTRLMTSAAALLAVLAALLVAIPLMSTRSAAADNFDFVTGINDDGSLTTESKPYTSISTYEDFQKINESEDTLAGNYVLESDIILPSNWASIGSVSGKPFDGCFDGKGYTITIGADTSGSNMKLAPFFNNNGVIHNVKVNGTVSVNTYFGSIVSSNNSGAYVIDCSSEADITVTGAGSVGGIAYSNDGTIIICWNIGIITGRSNASGICYIIYSNGKVTSSYNVGALSADRTFGISGTTDKDKIQHSYYMSDAPGDDINARKAKAFASGEVSIC